ncbi:zinc ribbon domain-containing protein [Phycicoccus endophyticus]|uniref:Zinc ribbon domain-containing protein n=1 Tax=Phycicoccus endophyticus TaxID=1690220 RepID=A0A7G9R0L4_9MICO|nr:zinc ribbon domain-containing protein [Phycicoccus endophyticus]NHI19418.1 zinc ribbon domain-containing protein [Phycicoccus endophyticus]QNN49139.1 zinc ribbon domain-containing protein [Phycicoccus endophyticus]GGL38942.1 hypothetical protein GCM10012283_21870 [Phycicoccus endophyticus]
MPTYLISCPERHRHEVLQPMAAPLPPCPSCGGATHRVPAAVGLSGIAGLPPRPEQMPQTWRGTHEGNREYLGELRRTAEARRRVEERHPEVAGDTRPIIAHEGRYEGAPLRAGEPVGHGHTHGHTHGHGHSHGHGGAGGSPAGG